MATDGTSPDDGTGLTFGDGTSGNESLASLQSPAADGGEFDEHGTRYDPAIHSPNRTKTRDGRWRRRKGSGGAGNSGSASRTSGKQTSKGSVSVSGVETLLVGIFAGISYISKAPEWALEPDESAPLAKSVKEVADLYDMPDMTEKGIKWTALAMTAGPMIMAKSMLIKQRKDEEKAAKARPINEPQNDLFTQ